MRPGRQNSPTSWAACRWRWRQAAAVIAAQHLSYATYLERLRRLPVADLLAPEEAGEYPRGVAAAVLLSLEAVRAGTTARRARR